MTLEKAKAQANKYAEKLGGRWQVVFSMAGGYQIFPARMKRTEYHELVHMTSETKIRLEEA